VLYQIDPAPFQAAHDNAKAMLAKSEANVSVARLKAERFRKLVSQGAVSQQEYDDATAARQQAEADLQYSKALVKTARISLDYTRISAPISGRIGKSNVTVGALATANQAAPLAVIQQIDSVYVDVTQSNANLLKFRQNLASGRIRMNGSGRTPVKLLLEDGTPYALPGSLKFSDVTVDPGTGSFVLRMVFPNPEQILLPGMYVRAVLEEGVIEQALLVPQKGVSRDAKGNATALVVDGTGKVEQRILTVDRSIGDRWLVTEGLKAGDRLILEGLQKAKPGSQVKVAPQAPEAALASPPAGDSQSKQQGEGA
jgi:membrane fusion protein (multidrug efflux system)